MILTPSSWTRVVGSMTRWNKGLLFHFWIQDSSSNLFLLPNVFSHFDFGRPDFSFSGGVNVDKDDVGLTTSSIGGWGGSASSGSEPRESQETLWDVTVRS